MNTLDSYTVQFALILVPVGLFIACKRKIASTKAKLACGVVLALFTGYVTYYLAAEHGWRPMAKRGRVDVLTPTALFAIHAVVLAMTFTVLTFAKKPKA